VRDRRGFTLPKSGVRLKSRQIFHSSPARTKPRPGQTFQRYNVGQHAIFYQQTGEGILVVRILHGMMDFDRHLD
jgi:plasmid stabilization system protein ParE